MLATTKVKTQNRSLRCGVREFSLKRELKHRPSFWQRILPQQDVRRIQWQGAVNEDEHAKVGEDAARYAFGVALEMRAGFSQNWLDVDERSRGKAIRRLAFLRALFPTPLPRRSCPRFASNILTRPELGMIYHPHMCCNKNHSLLSLLWFLH